MRPPVRGDLAIDVRDVTKTFRSGWLGRRATPALRGVSLAVEPGVIFGLLGPNGAGKTTLLSILTTLLVPDTGTARVLGLDVAREAAALRRRINMAGGRPSFLWSLRVGEIIAFYGRLYGLSGAALRARISRMRSSARARLGPGIGRGLISRARSNAASAFSVRPIRS